MGIDYHKLQIIADTHDMSLKPIAHLINSYILPNGQYLCLGLQFIREMTTFYYRTFYEFPGTDAVKSINHIMYSL